MYSVDNIQEEDDLDDSNQEIDTFERRIPTQHTDGDSKPFTDDPSDFRFKGNRIINIETGVFSIPYKYTPSNANHGFSTNHTNTTKSNGVPSFVNGTAWVKTAKKLAKLDHGASDSHLEETKLDTTRFEQSTLKRDVLKALGAKDSETSVKMRSTQSAKGIKSIKDIQQVDAAYNIKPSRPQTTSATNLIKQGRSFKVKNNNKASQRKYKLNEPSDDIFASSSENLSEFEDLLEKKTILRQNEKKRYLIFSLTISFEIFYQLF